MAASEEGKETPNPNPPGDGFLKFPRKGGEFCCDFFAKKMVPKRKRVLNDGMT